MQALSYLFHGGGEYYIKTTYKKFMLSVYLMQLTRHTVVYSLHTCQLSYELIIRICSMVIQSTDQTCFLQSWASLAHLAHHIEDLGDLIAEYD